jgi:branched-chain amino acid transport system permease protein
MKATITRLQGGFLIPIIVVFVLFAVFPIIGVPGQLLLYIFLFFIYLTMANMWNLLAGYSGLVSLCPAAFIGLAGYTLAMLTWLDWPWYFTIIPGGIVAALFALLISYPVFRMRGIYFSVATIVVPQILLFIFLLWAPVGGGKWGGGAGYAVKGVADVQQQVTYWMALVIGIASVIILRYTLRSKLGLGLAAIRDDDDTAASIGINVFRLKLTSFVISAFVTGIAGAIFYVYSAYIEPYSAFGLQWLIAILLATVIGGIGIQSGPIVGAIVYVVLSFFLARYANLNLLIQGIILIGIMLLAPQGIMGTILKIRPRRSLLRIISRR